MVHFYVDDTVLYPSAPSIGGVLSNLQTAFASIQHTLLDLKLVLNESKTYILLSRSCSFVDLDQTIC